MKTSLKQLVICIGVIREPDNKPLQTFLDIYSHPSKECSFRDLSGTCEHQFNIPQIDAWLAMHKGYNRDTHLSDEICRQMHAIKELMIAEKATHFRLVNEPS